MDPLATIIGLGLTSFLLFFFSSQLEEKHGFLKLLTIFIVLALLILIPNAVIDGQTSCEPVVNSTTINANTTTYTYTDHCITIDNNTNATFFKGVILFYVLFILYVILYLGYEALMLLQNSFQNKGRK